MIHKLFGIFNYIDTILFFFIICYGIEYIYPFKIFFCSLLALKWQHLTILLRFAILHKFSTFCVVFNVYIRFAFNTFYNYTMKLYLYINFPVFCTVWYGIIALPYVVQHKELWKSSNQTICQYLFFCNLQFVFKQRI